MKTCEYSVEFLTLARIYLVWCLCMSVGRLNRHISRTRMCLVGMGVIGHKVWVRLGPYFIASSRILVYACSLLFYDSKASRR